MSTDKAPTEQTGGNESIFGPILSTLFALGGGLLVDFEADSIRVFTHLLLHRMSGVTPLGIVVTVVFVPISIGCLWFFAGGIERNFGSRYARIGLIGALFFSELFHPFGNACDLLKLR